MPTSLGEKRTALVIGHPGHELRIHGWLEAVQPLVCVLSDGSGQIGSGRLGYTERVVRNARARPGPVFGRYSDRSLYQALLRHDHSFFLRLAEELANTWTDARIDHVVGDLLDGVNPTHDVCRLVTEAALARMPWPVTSHEFPLVGLPDWDALERAPLVFMELDENALARKLAAAAAYGPLRHEILPVLARHGEDAFRRECFWPSSAEAALRRQRTTPPFYETYGARQVAGGHYTRVIRYREHLAPLTEALRRDRLRRVS